MKPGGGGQAENCFIDFAYFIFKTYNFNKKFMLIHRIKQENY